MGVAWLVAGLGCFIISVAYGAYYEIGIIDLVTLSHSNDLVDVSFITSIAVLVSGLLNIVYAYFKSNDAT